MANPYIKGIAEGEVSGIPADMQPQILRKQKLAEQLLAQGQQPLEGQMVGGIYVAPSWTQYLAKGVQSYMGGKGLRDVENQQTEALKAKREAIANILKGQTPQMVGDRQETPEEVQARLRPQMYEAVSQYGNDPALQLALGDLNYSRERGARKQDIAEERAYTDTREEKLYNRNRADKLSDTQADREFQRILEKDRQGFQLTQQDRQFAQAYKMQQAQQAFQAQQQRQSQAFQAGQNQLTRAQQLELAKAKTVAQLGANGQPLPKLTEDQGKAMGWLSQANNAYQNMNKVIYDEKGNLKTNVVKPSLLETGAQTLGMEGTANAIRSPQRQQFMQATSSMGEALLRAATGAGVTRDEALQKQRELTPQFTDSAEVVKQKLDAIPVYLESLKARAGAGANLVPNLNTKPPAGGVKFLGFE